MNNSITTTERDLEKGYGSFPAKEAAVFDMETAPHPALRANLAIEEKVKALEDLEVDDLKSVADAEEVKLGNRKTREAVYKCLLDHYDKIVHRAALKPYGCIITAVGLGYLGEDSVMADAREDEKELLTGVMSRLGEEPVLLCGFNIREFDIPRLRVRCGMLGVDWPSYLPRDRRGDRYDRRYVFDLRDILDEGSLDTWLRMAGLPPKTGSGLNAQNLTRDEVIQYVSDDVELTRQLIYKFIPISNHWEMMP